MTTSSRHPRIYEISTWVWLGVLSRKSGSSITLKNVPKQEWDAIAQLGVDAVWFMGVWERSPAGLAIARTNPSLMADFRRALPDLAERDIVGSPYCVRQYVVDAALGGPDGLAEARKQLAQRGLKLILDFVPNHVAPDHPWTVDHPEYFIGGDREDLAREPASFLERNGRIFACGRDPYFPAWPDVLQLNAFDPGHRRAAIATVSGIAELCDGVRCDMSMLFINSIFERTWGKRAGPKPSTEYWPDLITAVKKGHSQFIFMAEAYWDLEWELHQQGFDYCYDKRLYDRMEHGHVNGVRQHLCADLAYQSKLVRFLENHDEPRAAATFQPHKHRAAAVTILTLPGAKLLYEGQFEGLKTRLPVFLARRPAESSDRDLERFYRQLLDATAQEPFRSGDWALCECIGWADNPSCQSLFAWCWRKADARCLVIVNFSDSPAQAMVKLPWGDLAKNRWVLKDSLSGDKYDRDGGEMAGTGLYVSLEAWRWHFFSVEAMK
jgi:glycosidase